MTKIGIWGQLGGDVVADGQAIRTRYLIREIVKRYGEKSLLISNTQGWKKRPIRLLVSSVLLFLKSKVIIILPANKGLRAITLLYNFFSLFFKREKIYFVIGGFLDDFLEKNPRYIKILAKYNAFFVQTFELKVKLENRGFKNVIVIPNFKELPTLTKEEVLDVKISKPFRLCIVSRITEEKGISIAADSIKILNTDRYNGYELDIFGIVDEKFKIRFETLLRENKQVLYKGVIPYDNTTKYLKNYHALLFPTFYPGEGFAGCLLDAFSAGLPIIATNWMANSEIVKTGINGLIVEPKSAKSLADAIIELESDEKRYLEFRLNNFENSKKFKPEYVLKPFFELIDQYILKEM